MLGVALRMTAGGGRLALVDAFFAPRALLAASQTGRHAAGGVVQASTERGAARSGTGTIRLLRTRLFAAAVVRRRAVRGAGAPDAATGQALGPERDATLAQTRTRRSAGVPAFGATRQLGRGARIHADAGVADARTRADVGRPRRSSSGPADHDRPEHHRESHLSHGNSRKPVASNGQYFFPMAQVRGQYASRRPGRFQSSATS